MKAIHRFQRLRGGIPRQNLLFYARDGVTDSIGVSISQYTVPEAGTKYYVDATNGDDTNNGLSKETAWKTMSKVNTVSLFDPGDIVYFKGGETWDATLLTNSQGSAAGHITYSNLPGWGLGLPIISPTSGIGINCNSFDYIRLRGLHVNNATSAGIYTNGSDNSIIELCQIRNSATQGINCHTASNLVIRGSIIAGNGVDGIIVEQAAASVSVENCIVTGNAYSGIRQTDGTLSYKNCTVVGNTVNFSIKNVQGTVTDGGGNIDYSPAMTKGKISDTFWVLTIDDRDIDYWKDVATALAPSGGKLTAYLARYPDNNNTGTTDDLPALIAAGHEIGNHAWSHVNLTSTTLFTISSTNADPTIDVDVAGQQIILATSTPGNSVTQSFANGETIADLVAAVSSRGWTIGSILSSDVKLSGAADSSGAQAAPYTVTPDMTAPNYQFWENEIGDNGVWVESVTGIAPTTQSYPGNYTNADLREWLASRGDYVGARAGSGNSFYLNSLEIFNINTFKHTDFAGTEEEVRRRTDHFYEWGQQQGGIVCILTHNATELTTEQIGWIADQLSKKGVSFVTMKTATDSVRETHDTSDNLTFTRNYEDVFDGHLESVSPCIGSGTDPFADGDGDQYDADGYMVWSDTFNAPVYHWRDGVDIGPYAYGGGSKVLNTPTIISGNDLSDYVLEFPICPTLYEYDDGSIYTGIVPNQINLATFVDTDQMRWGSTGGVFYSVAQDAATITKIDRKIGN